MLSTGTSLSIRAVASRGNSETSIASTRSRRDSIANASTMRSVCAEYGS